MILIVLEFHPRSELVARWPELVRDFTEGTLAEEGNLFFQWSRSLDEPDTFLLLQGFRDPAAAQVHVEAEHHARFLAQAPDWLAAPTRILHFHAPELPGWADLPQLRPRS